MKTTKERDVNCRSVRFNEPVYTSCSLAFLQKAAGSEAMGVVFDAGYPHFSACRDALSVRNVTHEWFDAHAESKINPKAGHVGGNYTNGAAVLSNQGGLSLSYRASL